MRSTRAYGSAFAITAEIVFAGLADAQNLAVNGSFEDYTFCPTNLSQVDRAVGWTDVSQSPDYFNRCNSNDSVSVPVNIVGNQEPYGGDAHMGMCTYLQGIPTYRECIQAQLASPLMPGIPVHLSMMVSPGGFGNDPLNNSIRYASSGIGMKFSMQAHTTFTLWPGNVAMQLPNVLSDTSGWMQLTAVYVPDSAYEYVVVGCFLPDSMLVVEELDEDGQWSAAYSFVDAVCVSYYAADCPSFNSIIEQAPAIMICGGGVVGDELNFRLNNLLRHGWIELLDVVGRVIRHEMLAAGSCELQWSISDLPNGPYFIRLRSGRAMPQTIKIMHVSP